VSVTANGWWIGRSQGGEYFDGGIDDVRLSNRVLSAAEIQALYAAMTNGPTCALASPTNGAVFNTNAIALAANVANNGNAINKVEFLNGPSVIGVVSNAPYNFTWSGVAPGNYTLKARTWFSPANYAVDSAAAAIQVILPVNTTPTNVTFTATTGQLTLTWPADRIGWRLEVQTNGLNTGLSPSGWFTVSNSAQTNTVVLPVDPDAPSVFYRLVYP
jgi:hypothetical protein